MSQSKKNSHLKLIKNETSDPNFVPRIALLIPAYNEEKNIGNVVKDVQALRDLRPNWDILSIIINDGSVDRTAEVLQELKKQYSLKVVNLPLNLGIGCAIHTGLQVAHHWGADIVLQLDGDGQHPSEEVPKIVGPILSGDADVVVGSRYLRGGGGNVSSLSRRLGTGFFSLWLKLLIGKKIYDTTSGFRAFSRHAAHILMRTMADDYPEVQAYVPLARNHFKILEVPVIMRPRKGGESSITFIRSIYYMFKVAIGTFMDVLRPIPKISPDKLSLRLQKRKEVDSVSKAV